MDWESFYDTHPSPSNYESIITTVENFVCSHENEKMVLITVSISTYIIPSGNNTYYLCFQSVIINLSWILCLTKKNIHLLNNHPKYIHYYLVFVINKCNLIKLLKMINFFVSDVLLHSYRF